MSPGGADVGLVVVEAQLDAALARERRQALQSLSRLGNLRADIGRRW